MASTSKRSTMMKRRTVVVMAAMIVMMRLEERLMGLLLAGEAEEGGVCLRCALPLIVWRARGNLVFLFIFKF
jgi:hypothetical protein